MIILATWALLGLLIGAAGVFLAPFVVGVVAGGDLQDRAGGWFVDQTMTLLGSAALIAKNRGGVSLRPTTSQPKLEADSLTVDGEEGHLKDDFDVKNYLTGNEFGVATDAAPVYVTPLLAELGDEAAKADHRDRVGTQPDGGVRLDFELPAGERLADLERTRHLLTGSADLRDGVVAENWAKISQEKFHENLGIKETLLLVMSFAAGVSLAFMIAKYGGGAGAPSTTVPIQVVGGAFL